MEDNKEEKLYNKMETSSGENSNIEIKNEKKEDNNIETNNYEKLDNNKETEYKDKLEEDKINAEEVKKEAFDTVEQVKETIKNVDIKKDSIETKGFIIQMFKNPINKMQEIVNKNNGKYLTYAIIILAIWVTAEIVRKSFSFKHIWGLSNVSSALISIVVSGVTPIISILVLSFIISAINRRNKKHLTTIITIVIAASIPLVLASVISLLTIYSIRVSIVTVPFTKICSIMSIVFMYFATKSILEIEKDSECIKKFIKIEIIYYIVYIVLSLLNINI